MIRTTDHPGTKQRTMANVALKLKKEQWKAKALGEMKTEGDVKNTAIKAGVEMLLSVLVGGAIGSYLGRPSFLLGLTATTAGHYFGVNWLPPVGIGMMASSNPMGIDKSVSGFDLAGGKDRLKAFKDSLLHRTYLDKIIKKKSVEENTSGFGDINDQNQTLNEVEKQLVQSAMEFQKQRGESTAGMEDDMQGVNENEPDFSGM